jgi:hypothetical protein
MTGAALKAVREMAMVRASVYPFTLRFTREFTAGVMTGGTHDDSIGFCKEADGIEWVSVINQKNKAGKLDYKVVAWRIDRA